MLDTYMYTTCIIHDRLPLSIHMHSLPSNPITILHISSRFFSASFWRLQDSKHSRIIMWHQPADVLGNGQGQELLVDINPKPCFLPAMGAIRRRPPMAMRDSSKMPIRHSKPSATGLLLVRVRIRRVTLAGMHTPKSKTSLLGNSARQAGASTAAALKPSCLRCIQLQGRKVHICSTWHASKTSWSSSYTAAPIATYWSRVSLID